MDKILTPGQAAQYLKISQATVKNWVKSGILTTLSPKLLKDFKENQFAGRLSLRANKQVSRRQFSPDNYGGATPFDVNKIREALAFFKDLPLEIILFFAVEDLIDYHPPITNSFLAREMRQWETTLFKEQDKEIMRKGNRFPPLISSWRDFPGWLYQSLEHEGSKSSKGAYFTPINAAVEIINELLSEDTDLDFFDPSCGTGTFLTLAALKLDNPQAVSGQDSDPLAVRLARINLMILFPQREFDPQIYQGNSLLSPHPELRERKFRRIGTNPPWGYRFSEKEKKDLRHRYGLAALESSSCFLLSAMSQLLPEGKIGMLLPESLLHRERHGEIRERLLNGAYKIIWFGQIFTKVQSQCFALFLGGNSLSEGETLEIIRPDLRYERTKKSLHDRPLNIWDIFTTPLQEEIFKKIFARPHLTLKGNCRWGMGIVTGNNRFFLKDRAGKNVRPLISGKDISSFNLTRPSRYLNYHDQRLQQKANLEDYEAPKILYRFIAENPVMALDEKGYLLLNSVNYLIPSVPLDWEILILLFNSRLYAQYFQKTFHTLKILKSQLETLPVPYLNDKEKKQLSRIYHDLCHDYEKHKARGDDLVYQLFNITKEEREILEKDL